MPQYVITEYEPSFGNDVLLAIGQDPDWDIFTKSETQKTNYKKMLQRSVTYVCYSGNDLCGYIRAILDDGFAIYISELYVKQKYRNNLVGQRLIEKIKEKYSRVTVYALSDEDLFYEKKGYNKIGSVFEI